MDIFGRFPWMMMLAVSRDVFVFFCCLSFMLYVDIHVVCCLNFHVYLGKKQHMIRNELG